MYQKWISYFTKGENPCSLPSYWVEPWQRWTEAGKCKVTECGNLEPPRQSNLNLSPQVNLSKPKPRATLLQRTAPFSCGYSEWNGFPRIRRKPPVLPSPSSSCVSNPSPQRQRPPAYLPAAVASTFSSPNKRNMRSRFQPKTT